MSDMHAVPAPESGTEAAPDVATEAADDDQLETETLRSSTPPVADDGAAQEVQTEEVEVDDPATDRGLPALGIAGSSVPIASPPPVKTGPQRRLDLSAAKVGPILPAQPPPAITAQQRLKELAKRNAAANDKLEKQAAQFELFLADKERQVADGDAMLAAELAVMEQKREEKRQLALQKVAMAALARGMHAPGSNTAETLLARTSGAETADPPRPVLATRPQAPPAQKPQSKAQNLAKIPPQPKLQAVQPPRRADSPARRYQPLDGLAAAAVAQAEQDVAAAADAERVVDEQAHEEAVQWEMSLQAGAASRYPEPSRRRLAEGQIRSNSKWGQQKKGKPTLTWATMLDFEKEQALKNALALISQRFDEHHPRLDPVTGGPLIEQGGHGMAKPRAVAPLPQPQLSPAKRGRSPEPAKPKAAAAKAKSASPAPARSQGKKKKREVVEVADSEDDMSESDIANLSDADFARVLAKQQAKAAKTVAKLKEESKKRRREEEEAEKQAQKEVADAKAKKTAERMALMAQAKSKQPKDGSDDEGQGGKKGSSAAGRARTLGH